MSRFKPKPLDVRIRGKIAYVGIRYRGAIREAIFDAEDVPKLRALNCSFCLRTGYVCCRYRPMGESGDKARKFRQVSGIIMDCPDNMVVDHINGDKLDNRKSNLRIVTQRENSQNRTRLNKNNTSGVPCVLGMKYVAEVSINGKRTSLGLFDTIEEAAAAIEKISGRKPRPANKQSQTGIRGIYPVKPKAAVRRGGQRYYLGSFDTVEEAEQAVEEFRRQTNNLMGRG